MRKLTLLLVLTAAFGMAAEAQRKTTYALELGINAAFQSIQLEYGSIRPLPLPFIAGMADIPLGGKLSLSPGFSLQQKGTRVTTPNPRADASAPEYRLRMTYLEVPVLLNYHFMMKKSPFTIGAGVYTAVGIWGKERDDYSSASAFKSVPGRNAYRSADNGLKLKTAIGLKKVQLFLQYAHGLTNVAPDAWNSYPSEPAPPRDVIKNRVITAGVSFVFPPKQRTAQSTR